MFYFARVIITGLLVVYRKPFSSIEEAIEWNNSTGICANMEVIHQEKIDAWKSMVLWVPVKGKNSDV